MSARPKVGIPKELLAPHAVSRWAAEAPDRVAVQEVDGGSYTYAELDAASRTWASAFRRIGVTDGQHVATMLPNGFDAHLAWLGLAWLRGIEVPLNPALTGVLLHHALVASDAEVLVIAEQFVDRLLALEAPLPRLDRVVVLGDQPIGDAAGAFGALGWDVHGRDEFLAGAEPAADVEGPVYRDIASILFTSGTTGPSKGVRVPWSIVHHFWSWVPTDTVEAGEAVYCPLPVVHNSGRSCLNFCLGKGATFVFRERFSGTTFWDDVRRYDCKAASLVGPMTALLHSEAPAPDDADNPLRAVIAGPLIPEIEEFKARFGVRVATCYGMTETGAILTTGWDHGPWQNCGRARTDYPWPEVRVVDENDEPVGPGEVGELVVRSAEPWSLNAGYYGLPERTAEAWRNGWFHTGDAFRYDEDGWYYLVDRMKDAIRRRGENISSFEVEAIVREHPDVVDCAAVAVPAELGEDEVLVVVEVADPDGFDPAGLASWLEGRMPRFMQPRYIEAVAELPRNATTQRVKKYELRERGLSPAAWDREKGT